MKSKTSFSKLTVFKKDITRFAPVWVVYTIGLLMSLFSMMDYRHVAYELAWTIEDFGVVNLIYAGVVVQVLFGDLYNSRICNALHAFPQRREHWFASHLAAGLCFSLVPNVLGALIVMTRAEGQIAAVLFWLLAVELEYLFFFGVAVFCALCVGNRFAAVATYGVLNFLSVLAWWFMETIYEPMLYGVEIISDGFYKTCPTVNLFDYEYMEFEKVYRTTAEKVEGTGLYMLQKLSDGWGYLAVIAALGVVLMGVALVLYRRRNLESAGDFVAFRPLAPVVCVVMTLCVGAGFAFMGDNILGGGYVVWLIVGLIVGYFGALMLLQRRVKVFTKKAFAWMAVFGAVITASILLVAFDVFGVVGWVPDAQQVEAVYVQKYDNIYYDNEKLTITDPEAIDAILEAHEEILDNRDRNGDNFHVVLTYELKDGRTVKRSYFASVKLDAYDTVRALFNTPENILGYAGRSWEELLRSVGYVSINGADPEDGTWFYYELTPELIAEFLEAVLADCENGEIFSDSTYVDYDKVTDISIDYQVHWTSGDWTYRYLMVGENAENVLAWLEAHEDLKIEEY